VNSALLDVNVLIALFDNPAYRSVEATASDVILRLRLCSSQGHHFWQDDLCLLDGAVFLPEAVASHRQITEYYLLALAVRHGGRLATLTVPSRLSQWPAPKPTAWKWSATGSNRGLKRFFCPEVAAETGELRGVERRLKAGGSQDWLTPQSAARRFRQSAGPRATL
jgi:hypothetical protein